MRRRAGRCSQMMSYNLGGGRPSVAMKAINCLYEGRNVYQKADEKFICLIITISNSDLMSAIKISPPIYKYMTLVPALLEYFWLLLEMTFSWITGISSVLDSETSFVCRFLFERRRLFSREGYVSNNMEHLPTKQRCPFTPKTIGL